MSWIVQKWQIEIGKYASDFDIKVMRLQWLTISKTIFLSSIFVLFSFISCKYCQNFFVSLQPSLKVQGRISSLIAILITSRRGEFSIWMFGGNVSKFWSKKLWETFSTKDHLLLFLTNEEDALKWKHAAPTFYSAFCVVLRTYKL